MESIEDRVSHSRSSRVARVHKAVISDLCEDLHSSRSPLPPDLRHVLESGKEVQTHTDSHEIDDALIRDLTSCLIIPNENQRRSEVAVEIYGLGEAGGKKSLCSTPPIDASSADVLISSQSNSTSAVSWYPHTAPWLTPDGHTPYVSAKLQGDPRLDSADEEHSFGTFCSSGDSLSDSFSSSLTRSTVQLHENSSGTAPIQLSFSSYVIEDYATLRGQGLEVSVPSVPCPTVVVDHSSVEVRAHTSTSVLYTRSTTDIPGFDLNEEGVACKDVGESLVWDAEETSTHSTRNIYGSSAPTQLLSDQLEKKSTNEKNIFTRGLQKLKKTSRKLLSRTTQPRSAVTTSSGWGARESMFYGSLPESFWKNNQLAVELIMESADMNSSIGSKVTNDARVVECVSDDADAHDLPLSALLQYRGKEEYSSLLVAENLDLYFQEQVFGRSRPSYPSPYLEHVDRKEYRKQTQATQRDTSATRRVRFLPPHNLDEWFVCMCRESVVVLDASGGTVDKGTVDVDEEEIMLIVVTNKCVYVMPDLCPLDYACSESSVPSADQLTCSRFCDAPVPKVFERHPLHALR